MERTGFQPGCGFRSLSPLTDSGLVLVNAHKHPVITIQTNSAARIKYGFEGGRVVKVKDTYHLFTSDMVDRPIWVKMKLGYWTSKDK